MIEMKQNIKSPITELKGDTFSYSIVGNYEQYHTPRPRKISKLCHRN